MMGLVKTLTAILVVFLVLMYFGMEYLVPSDENKAAGESIAAAVQAYKQADGRYPKRLEDLVPTYLPAVPKAGKHFYILYAVEPDGSQCWVAYQVHRDRYEELDCRQRTWVNYEVEDAQVSKHADAQRLVPEMWRQ